MCPNTSLLLQVQDTVQEACAKHRGHAGHSRMAVFGAAGSQSGEKYSKLALLFPPLAVSDTWECFIGVDQSFTNYNMCN